MALTKTKSILVGLLILLSSHRFYPNSILISAHSIDPNRKVQWRQLFIRPRIFRTDTPSTSQGVYLNDFHFEGEIPT